MMTNTLTYGIVVAVIIGWTATMIGSLRSGYWRGRGNWRGGSDLL